MSFLNKTPKTKTKSAKSRGSSVFEDKNARAFLKEAINDLMIRNDRRTRLEYFRITSSPTSASPSTSTSSSGMGSLKKPKVAPRRMSPEPPLLRTTTSRSTNVGGSEKRASKKVDSMLNSASSRPISVTRRLSLPVTSHKTLTLSRPSAAATTTSSSGVKSSSTISLNTRRKSAISNSTSQSRRGSTRSASRNEMKKQNHRTSERSTSSGVRKSYRASKLGRKSRRSLVASGAGKSDASVQSASSGKGRSNASNRSASSDKKKSRASIRSASTNKGKARSASVDLRKSRRMSIDSDSSGARKSRTLVRSASASRAVEQKRRDNSFFLDGSEYLLWLADSNAKNQVIVPTTMVPMRGRVGVSGVFKSQLVKYRPQERQDSEKIDAYMKKRSEFSGAENPPWTPQTSQVSVDTTRTPKPVPRVRNPLFTQSITPKQLKHAEKLLGKHFGLSTSLKNMSRSSSGKSKKLTTSTVSHPSSSGAGSGVNSINGMNNSVPLARSGSTAALFSDAHAPSSASQHLLGTPRLIPLTFTPMVHSTPIQPVRRTMSEMALVSQSPVLRATQSLHAAPTTSSSVYRTPVRKTPPTKWLIDATKQMERAHSEGRRAVLTMQTPLRTRVARRPRSLTPLPNVRSLSSGGGGGRIPVSICSRSASASVSPSKKPIPPTPAPRTVSLAPVGQKSLTKFKLISNVDSTSNDGNELPKFTHNKKIKMRLLVDQNEHIDADCSLHFESSSRNPKIKVTELCVDDHPIWRKGSDGGGNASLNNNSSVGGASNGGNVASSPSSVSTGSSSTGLYYHTPPSTL